MGLLPENVWQHGDDACDCTFQRIGMWTNPYLAETLEVRMCCIWEELYKLFPQHVRRVPAYLTNNDDWETEPREWDGETEMPRALWYRQQARRDGTAVADARSRYAHLTPPQGTPRPVVEQGPAFAEVLLEMVMGLAEEVAGLKAQLEAR